MCDQKSAHLNISLEGMVSTDKTNIKAGKGNTWRIPTVFLSISEFNPLFSTHVCMPVYNMFTKLIKDSMNSKCSLVFRM